MGSAWSADRRIVAAGMAATVVVGFAVAAAVDALAAPAVAVAGPDDYGPGDGLTRWVLGTADPAALVVAAAATPGVVNAQPLFDGGVLVATDTAGPAELAAIPGTTSVEPSVSAQVQADPTDPYWSRYGYNLENTGSNAYQGPIRPDADVDATAGWAATTGRGTVIAVIDTGYDSDHPDLVGALWTNPDEACGSVDSDGDGLAGDCHGWNFTTGTADVDNGANGIHGTNVAGVAAARAGNGVGSAGVAPEATIMPLVIGSGSSVDVNLGAQAIRYAVDHGADVINASWGGPGTTASLASAVAYAGAHGVLVVAAAGNDAADRDTTPMYPASLTDDAVVTVGNSTAADTLSSSSAYGATSVDLMAPGDYVFTTWNDGGYRLVSGTSIAAPQVAAAVAMYRSLMPSATAAEIKQALLADVDPVPAFAGKSVSGGRLTTDGLAALGSQQVRWTYSSMTGAPGPLTPALTTSTSLPAGSYTAVLGLGMRVGGQVYAVSGQPLTVGGSTLTTDDTGTVAVPLGTRGPASGTLVISPATTLTEGSYVLTVQLLQDTVPLGRASAAPLTVGTTTTAPSSSAGATGSTTASPTTTAGAPGPGGSSSPGSTSPGGPGTGSPGSTSPRAGTTSPGGPTTSGSPGGPSGSSPTATGSSAPTTTGPAGPTTTAPSTTGAGPTSAPVTTGAGPTSGGGTAPGGGSTAPGGGTTTPAVTSGPASPTSAAPTGSTAPPTGTTVYPGVGDFRVTSVSPSQVDVAGGTPVTVQGTFSAQPRVRVGATAQATVTSWSPTQVVFTAPARVAGTYDLLLTSTSGSEQSALPGALTYVSSSAGPTPTSASSTSASSTSAPTTTGAPTTSAPTSAAPVVITGPGGQRLVGTAFFAGLPTSIWSINCSTSCAGTLV